MATLRPRNDPVRLFMRRLGLAALFLVVLGVGWGTWRSYREEQASAALRSQAESQLADLTTRQNELNTDISKLETARGKEEVLRDQYALAGRGEGLIVIVDSTGSEVHATSSAFAQWLHNTFPWW
jgi:cell division protein FtsB